MSLADFQQVRPSITLLLVAGFILGFAINGHSTLHPAFKILDLVAVAPLLAVMLGAEFERIDERKREP